MFKLLYIAICIAGMIGFFYLIRHLAYDYSLDFTLGLGTGMFLFVFMFWLGERLGAFQVVEPSKGVWTPHDQPSAPVRRDRNL